MGRLQRCSHYAMAESSGISAVEAFRGGAHSTGVVIALAWYLCVVWCGSPLVVPCVCAAVEASVETSVASSHPSVFALKRSADVSQLHNSESHTNGQNGPSWSRPIAYADCRLPLVVGGQILRCDGKREGGSTYSDHFGNYKNSVGPLLNQSFAVELSAEFLRHRVSSERNTETATKGAAVSEELHTYASQGEGEHSAAADSHAGNQRKEGLSEDPYFIRIFGHWAPFLPELHLWSNMNQIFPPLSHIVKEPDLSAYFQQKSPSRMSPRSGQKFDAQHADNDAKASEGINWRALGLLPSVQNLCIALIRLPYKAGHALSPPSESLTSRIPDSCKEAQTFLFSQAPPSEPFWLSCGPQMVLSKLAHFLTFSLSQEKLHQVLAFLGYNVEIWREPHAVKTDMGPIPLAQGVGNAQQTALKEGLARAQEQPATSSPRNAEARRLAAHPGKGFSWKLPIKTAL